MQSSVRQDTRTPRSRARRSQCRNTMGPDGYPGPVSGSRSNRQGGRPCFAGRWRSPPRCFSFSLRPLSARSTWPALTASAIPSSRRPGTAATTPATTTLTLDYDQPDNFLEGTAVIEATATQNLRRFNLDFRDFYAISSLTVNGEPAQFARPGAQELAITPATRINAGDVHRAGRLRRQAEADQGPGQVDRGLGPDRRRRLRRQRAAGRARLVPGQRQPAGQGDLRLHGHGARGAHRDGQRRARLAHRGDGKETWRWREDSPMASYLATATNGAFVTEFYTARQRAADVRRGRSGYAPAAVDPTRPNPDARLGAARSHSRRSSTSSPAYTAPTRSPAAAGSSTGRPTSATRSSRRRGPTTTASPARRPLSTRSPTSGSATRSRSRSGRTSGSTRASRPSPSGSTPREHGGPSAAERFDELYAIPESDPVFEDLWFPAPAALAPPEPALPHSGL